MGHCRPGSSVAFEKNVSYQPMTQRLKLVYGCKFRRWNTYDVYLIPKRWLRISEQTKLYTREIRFEQNLLLAYAPQ